MLERIKSQKSIEKNQEKIFSERAKIEKQRKKKGKNIKISIGKFADQFPSLGIIHIKKEAGSDIKYNHQTNDLYRQHWPEDEEEEGYQYSLELEAWLDLGPEIIKQIVETANKKHYKNLI